MSTNLTLNIAKLPFGKEQERTHLLTQLALMKERMKSSLLRLRSALDGRTRANQKVEHSVCFKQLSIYANVAVQNNISLHRMTTAVAGANC